MYSLGDETRSDPDTEKLNQPVFYPGFFFRRGEKIFRGGEVLFSGGKCVVSSVKAPILGGAKSISEGAKWPLPPRWIKH